MKNILAFKKPTDNQPIDVEVTHGDGMFTAVCDMQGTDETAIRLRQQAAKSLVIGANGKRIEPWFWTCSVLP